MFVKVKGSFQTNVQGQCITPLGEKQGAIIVATLKRKENYWRSWIEFMKCYPLTLTDLDGEEWKPIPNYEAYYHESNYGRTKSFHRGMVKILRPKVDADGYLCVNLSCCGRKRTFRVNRLVAQLVILNPMGKPEVDHVYAMKFDNYFANLRWVTKQENKDYTVEQGCENDKGGEDSQAKLTNEQARYCRDNPDGLTLTALSKKFNVSVATIFYIQRGRTYSNAGGAIRKAKKQKYTPRLSDTMRAQIRAEYIRGDKDFGSTGLAKKYGVAARTILTIVHEK